jgi:hypothetical protein
VEADADQTSHSSHEEAENWYGEQTEVGEPRIVDRVLWNVRWMREINTANVFEAAPEPITLRSQRAISRAFNKTSTRDVKWVRNSKFYRCPDLAMVGDDRIGPLR